MASSAMGDVTGLPEATSFKVETNRPAMDMQAIEWNSSMDLLACLTAPPDSKMSVNRFFAEERTAKLLSEKISGVGTALAWSPCGRKIAVGDRLGVVTVYDGETGATLHVSRPHARPVAALSWAATEAVAPGDAPWSRMLPPLLAVPSSVGGMYTEALDAEAAEAPEGATAAAGLLSSVDEGGLVVVSAGGTLPLQAAQIVGGAGGGAAATWPEGLLEGCGEAPCALAARRPRAVRMSPDLRCLAVLLGPVAADAEPRAEPRTPPRRHGGAAAEGVVVVLDVRLLAVRRRELSVVAAKSERLGVVAGYVRRGAETLAQVWRNAAEGLSKKMRALAESIEAYSVDDGRSVQDELLLACCTGTPSDALHMFLMKQTSVQQLARLERGLMQAVEFAALVVSTRLQLAGHHLVAILHEMRAYASWPQKCKAIGLDAAPLESLIASAEEFNRLGERLLIECSQARRFVRTLFQVLLRLAQKLADQGLAAPEAGQVASVGAPTREALDEFIDRLRAGASLDLAEITGRIGPASASTAAAPGASLTEVARRLVADAAGVGERVVAAVSSRTAVLACVPVRAPSPWVSVGASDLQAAAASDEAHGIGSPRGLGRPALSISWEAPPGAPPRLLVLWAGGGGPQAELHLCRIEVPPARPGAPAPAALQRLRLSANGHFLLCQAYDAGRVVALLLQESLGASAVTVALLDVSGCEFHATPSLLSAEGEAPALPLAALPEGCVRRSAPLPECFRSASALRSAAARGVCSVYACRAKRLLTLDLENDGDGA